jgi:hypothetical protein
VQSSSSVPVSILVSVVMSFPPIFVIPGWSEGPDPESRDSGFATRPGMTAS